MPDPRFDRDEYLVQLTSNFPLLAEAVNQALPEIIKLTAENVQDFIEKEMQQVKHGRIYEAHIRHITGAGTHQASAPGEAPAIETGDYINSIGHEMLDPTTAIVYSTMMRGIWLELGTTRIAARPHFVPAAEANAFQFHREVMELIIDEATRLGF